MESLLLPLIELAKSMPPVVSAVISIAMCAVIWVVGKRMFAQMDAQMTELKEQTADLTKIKIQTTMTNGKVVAMERALSTHENLDEGRHQDMKGEVLLNRTTMHKLRDSVSEFAIKVGLQRRHAQEEHRD